MHACYHSLIGGVEPVCDVDDSIHERTNERTNQSINQSSRNIVIIEHRYIGITVTYIASFVIVVVTVVFFILLSGCFVLPRLVLSRLQSKSLRCDERRVKLMIKTMSLKIETDSNYLLRTYVLYV